MSYTKLTMEQISTCVYAKSKSGKEFHIAIFDAGGSLTFEECTSNARLFVHAGKMLEMLEKMLTILYLYKQTTSRFQDCGEPIDSIDGLETEITDLIAAAKGEA